MAEIRWGVLVGAHIAQVNNRLAYGAGRPTSGIVAAIIVLLSGCMGPGATSTSNDEDPQSPRGTIRITTDGGAAVVTVANGTGTVYGEVLSDAGFPLPGSRVTIWGADHGATTNQTGWFQVLDVPPGRRSVRAENENFRAAESMVNVEAGKAVRVTITLVAVSEDEGTQPHIHDYWNGRTSIVAVDSDFAFHENRQTAVYGEVLFRYNQVFPSLACRTGYGYTIVQGVSPIYFDEPTQIVPPGTDRIEVVLSWTDQDYPAGKTMGVVWRAPNTTEYQWSPSVENQGKVMIEVEPPEWDSAHQVFSLWEFYACLGGNGEKSEVAGIKLPTFYPEKWFLGSFHAKITLHSGKPVTPDEPHPRFWENGSFVPVLDGWANITCTAGYAACVNYQSFSRAEERNAPAFVFRPPIGVLVPPGSARLLVNLTWAYTQPIASHDLSMTYSPANRPPMTKANVATYDAPQPSASASGRREYQIMVATGETDGFYQKRSNWAFLWGHEGKEADAEFTHACPCTLTVHLTVGALREPRAGESA